MIGLDEGNFNHGWAGINTDKSRVARPFQAMHAWALNRAPNFLARKILHIRVLQEIRG